MVKLNKKDELTMFFYKAMMYYNGYTIISEEPSNYFYIITFNKPKTRLGGRWMFPLCSIERNHF